MNKLISLLLSLSISFFLASKVYAQLQTLSTIECNDDATINSASPTSNYGTAVNLQASVYQFPPPISLSGINRFYVKFDLSSIPENAVIYDAKVNFYQISYSGLTDLNLLMALSSWSESTVTWNTTVTLDNANPITIASPPNQSQHTYDITSFVTKWHEQGYPNYGFRVSCVDESAGNRGYTFYSSEHTSQNEPELVVRYYTPIDFEGNVVHCTPGNSDGSVNLSNISGGTGNYTIQWYNSSGLMSGQTTSSLSNLSAGYYVARLVDSDATYGTKCTKSKIFLVGTECEETSVVMQLPEILMDDVFSMNTAQYTNYGTTNYLYAGEHYNNELHSYLKYNFGGLDGIVPISAEIQLRRHWHIGFSSEDELQLEKKNFYWNESIATYSTLMSSESSTTNTFQLIQSPTYTWTADVLDGFKDYVQNPSSRFNFKMTRTDNSPLSSDNSYGFKSSNNSASIRPKLSITFIPTGNCFYSPVERRISSRLLLLANNLLKFSYDESYAIESGKKLDYKIFNTNRTVVAGVIGGSALVTGSPILDHKKGFIQNVLDLSSLSLSSGYYTLEVYLEKNETRYLKFKID